MQLIQTDIGILRDSADGYELLDTDISLDTAIKEGRLDTLAALRARRSVTLDEVTIQPPVQPGQFVIAGLNYRAHCEEIGRPVPESLVFGTAPGSAVSGAGAPIQRPPEAMDEVDYEGELGVVIGAPAERVQAQDAWRVIAGFVPLNDVSARDVQAAGNLEAVAKAKGFPTFKPIGPSLATPDTFTDPLDIGLETWVNGEQRQQGRTSDMVFDVPAIVEAVTAKLTLAPGDIICTGTPGGVAHGGQYPYLKAGDRVTIRIEGLPALTNVVRD